MCFSTTLGIAENHNREARSWGMLEPPATLQIHLQYCFSVRYVLYWYYENAAPEFSGVYQLS